MTNISKRLTSTGASIRPMGFARGQDKAMSYSHVNSRQF